MDIRIKKLVEQDVDRFIDLLTVFEVSFEMADFHMPPPAYLRRLLHQDSFWIFVALVDEQVVGGLTAHVLPHYYTCQLHVYLYDLAVSSPYQRQGIGRQLLASLLSHSYSLGVEEVFVQADGEDGEAIQFYEATQGRAEAVVQFTYATASQ